MDEIKFHRGYLWPPLQAFIMRAEATDGAWVRCKITFALLRERLNNPDATQADLHDAVRRDREVFEAVLRNMIDSKDGRPHALEPCTDQFAAEKLQVVLTPESFARFREH